MGAHLSPGGRGRGYRKQQMTDINVTPFVDVMLVLLVIFMITAPMLTTGVQVDLPDSKTQPVKGTDEPLAITVTSDGSVYIQDSKVKFDELQAKLKAIVGEKLDTRVFVRGDRKINYGQVMRVIGEVNGAGLNRVALITQSTGK